MRMPGGVFVITDRKQARQPLADIVRAALAAGVSGVMLREKDLPGAALYEIAESLLALCNAADRPLIVNDRLDVALVFPNVGAHVGARGFPVPDARRFLGPDRLLGYSAHEAGEALIALRDGADYVTLSPVFPSRSKPELSARGLELLEEAARVLPPGRVIALGGIDASNLAMVRRAGVHGAAVMGALMRAEDPGVTARTLVAAWEENK